MTKIQIPLPIKWGRYFHIKSSGCMALRVTIKIFQRFLQLSVDKIYISWYNAKCSQEWLRHPSLEPPWVLWAQPSGHPEGQPHRSIQTPHEQRAPLTGALSSAVVPGVYKDTSFKCPGCQTACSSYNPRLLPHTTTAQPGGPSSCLKGSTPLQVRLGPQDVTL